MGRSVSYLSGAIHKTYLQTDTDNDNTTDEYIARENWQSFNKYVSEVICTSAPSLNVVKNRWEDNEDQIILENCHCEIGLSEYYGLVCISIRIHSDYRTNYNLAKNWINKVWPSIKRKLDQSFVTLNKVGSFSNGECVFEQRTNTKTALILNH